VVGFKKPSFGVIHALYSRAFFGSRASSALRQPFGKTDST